MTNNKKHDSRQHRRHEKDSNGVLKGKSSKPELLEEFQDPEGLMGNYDIAANIAVSHGKPGKKVVKDGRTTEQRIDDLVNSVQV